MIVRYEIWADGQAPIHCYTAQEFVAKLDPWQAHLFVRTFVDCRPASGTGRLRIVQAVQTMDVRR